MGHTEPRCTLETVAVLTKVPHTYSRTIIHSMLILNIFSKQYTVIKIPLFSVT